MVSLHPDQGPLMPGILAMVFLSTAVVGSLRIPYLNQLPFKRNTHNYEFIHGSSSNNFAVLRSSGTHWNIDRRNWANCCLLRPLRPPPATFIVSTYRTDHSCQTHVVFLRFAGENDVVAVQGRKIQTGPVHHCSARMKGLE